MPKYHVVGSGGARAVTAQSETEARRLAMVWRWGSMPDSVTPHAPNYRGDGLSVTEMTDEPKKRETK